MLELGCGTGRNIVLAARLYPAARFFGLDISAAMLETAAANLARESIAGRATLAQGDATDFDAPDCSAASASTASSFPMRCR